MANRNFNSFDHFKSEVLFERSGPLSSAVEEVADEMYAHDIAEEIDTMWDSAEADEE
jgi:hypothetical protein